MLRKDRFDLVLLDMEMPEMTGFEVLEALAADPALRDLPVIVTSSLEGIDHIVRCIELGAEDYLPKPVNPVLLKARLNAILEKKRLRDQEVDYLYNVARITDAAAAVEAESFDPQALVDVATRADALGQLARVFSRMVSEIYVREQNLKRQVQQLRIELDDARQAQQVAEITETDYFQQLEDKAQDLLGALVQVQEGEDKLDHMELLSMIFLLLVAGHETTVNLIGNGTLALLQNPDQLELLKHDFSLMPKAIEELLRYNGPVETPTTRWASEDIEVGGCVIPVGDLVLPSLLAANRDPNVFTNPNQLDITRDPNPHLAFGAGIHYCLGAPLARLEGQIAMKALLERFPTLRLNAPVEDLRWSDNILLHGMLALPVAW